MGSNTEKKPWTNLQNSYKKWSKEIKSDNFCYRKVGRAITKWGAIQKSPILLSQYGKNYHFRRVTKIILHFDGSNNISADCTIQSQMQNINIDSLLGRLQGYQGSIDLFVQNRKCKFSGYLKYNYICHKPFHVWSI